VERMDHVPEQGLPLLGRFALGQPGDRVENQLVCPVVVAREHARGLWTDHGLPRSKIPLDYDTGGHRLAFRGPSLRGGGSIEPPPSSTGGGERGFFSCK